VDYLRILEQLIAMDTSVPPGRNYRAALEFLVPFFEETGFATELVAVPPEFAAGRPERFALIGRRPHAGRPHLIFYGHVDVVPAAESDAFTPRRADGRIYGRGAADMKGAIAALLGGLAACRGRELKYNVSVMITTDEELDQGDQLRYLGRYLEPLREARVWSLDSGAGYVSIAGLGTIQWDIAVQGRSVHSALCHLGENAVEKAIPLLNALSDLKRRVERRQSRVPAAPECGLSFMQARLNINMLQGGLKANIVPDECVITVDRRLIPEENVAAAREELQEALGKVPGVRWEIRNEFIIPTIPAAQDPMIDELERLLREQIGQGGRYGEMGSGDLGPIVVNEWGGRDFGLGVIRSECCIHGRNEYVYIKDIDDLARLIPRFLLPGQLSEQPGR
jgi:succinyl-diaminopimelate desuccinylase